jgi:hypothetical protein
MSRAPTDLLLERHKPYGEYPFSVEAYTRRGMGSAHWRCYFRWPPGHKWTRVTENEATFARCERCGKESDRPPSSPSGEDTISTGAFPLSRRKAG